MSDSVDGAQLGYTARTALDAILGGEDRGAQADLNTPDGMAYYLLLAPDNPTEYDDAARLVGKCAMEHLLDQPADMTLDVWQLGDRIYESHPILKGQGLTGFQVGWGINAARFALKAPPVPNPALIDIDVPAGTDEEPVEGQND